MYTPVLLALILTAGSLLSASGKRTVRQDGCTDDDARNRDFAEMYPQCASNLDAIQQPFEITLRDLYCNKTCGPLYESLFLSRCTSLSDSFTYRRLIDYYVLQCRVNEDGRPCYSFYNDSEIDMRLANQEAVNLCSSSQNSACSDACRARLEAISGYYGSCINSVFNSSYFQSFGHELLPLFTYRLWSNCEVPPPTAASVNPTTASAMAATPLKMVSVISVLLAFFSLYC